MHSLYYTTNLFPLQVDFSNYGGVFMTKLQINPPTFLSSDKIEAVRIENVPLFDVSKVFDCGQCFRFDPVRGTSHQAEYAGCAFGKYISVAQDGDTVTVYNTTVEEYEKKWKPFLSLDTDYGEINDNLRSLSNKQVLFDAIDAASGITISAFANSSRLI